MFLSENLYAKRKGSELIAQKKDEQSVRGELIAVKESSLLLLSESGANASVDIGYISKIKIVGKSNAWSGLLWGFISGGSIGIVVGAGTFQGLRTENYVRSFVACGLIGAVIVGAFDAASGADETIQIEGRSDSVIAGILEKLRSKARVPDYQ